MFDYNIAESNDLKSEILLACQRVSARLSDVSGMNITLSLASDEQLQEAHYEWQPRPFNWVGSQFDDHESVCVFKLSVVAENVFCGVLKASFEKEPDHNSLVLERVRGNPSEAHPLKGRVLDVFCEAALEIAKSIDVPRIDGEDPIDEIIDIYEGLGFELENRGLHDFVTLSVTSGTKLNHSKFSL